MPRGTRAQSAAQRDQASMLLDSVVAEAAHLIEESAAESSRLGAQFDEVEAAIEALQQRRAELFRQREAHFAAHRQLKAQEYARVYDLCRTANIPPTRWLQVAATLVFGSSEQAGAQVKAAIAEGRRLLRVLDDEPLLAVGYALLCRYGVWYGGRTTGRPTIQIVRNNICCISIPIRSRDGDAVCNVPIDGLVKPTDHGFVSARRVYIGEDEITQALRQELHGNQDDGRLTQELGASLRDAGLDPKLCDKAANS